MYPIFYLLKGEYRETIGMKFPAKGGLGAEQAHKFEGLSDYHDEDEATSSTW